MKRNQIIFITCLSLSLLCGCNSNTSADKTIKLTFYQDEGNQSDVMKVTLGKTTEAQVKAFQDAITLNPRRGYDVSWKNFSFASLSEDYVVSAKYVLHDYTITFKCGDLVLGTTTYNVLSKTIDEPDLSGEPGYAYVYEPFNFRNKAEDFTVQATKEEAQYSVTFKKGIDDTDPVVKYYSVSNPVVVTPEGSTGYVASWTNGVVTVGGGETLYFSGAMQNYTFIGDFTAKSYTITYNPNGGTMSATTQTVTYDQPYTLYDVSAAGSLEYVGWYDQSDTVMEKTGTWKTDSDVTLKAKWGFSFESGEVPSSFTALNRAALSISDSEATLGTHSLKIDVTAGSGNYQVKLVEDALNTMFTDPEVVAVNFDAKGTTATCNFRSRHNESTVSDWTYENNSNGYGLSTDWKTFTFKRAYLDGYVDIIEGYYEAGQTIYVDNFRAVYNELDGLGFECGAITDSRIYKNGGHANGNPNPTQIFSVRGDPASVVKSVTFDYKIKSEGLRSIHISRNNEYMALYITADLVKSLGDTGYLSFDIYTTIPINSNPTTGMMVDGLSTGGAAKPFGTGTYQHPSYTWVTYSLPASRMTADGRFLQLMGSTACEFYIDNLVIHK